MTKHQILGGQFSNTNHLPHNFLAEQMLLSCLLIDPLLIEKIQNMVSIKAFYFINHQIIYEVILEMSKKKLPIDVLTVATFCQEHGQLQKLGGVGVLLNLSNKDPNLVYLEEYVSLVKEKAVRRSLIQLGYKLISSGYIANITLEYIFEDLEQKLLDLNTFMVNPTVSNSRQILLSIFSELKDKFLNPGLPGISSGFERLDLITQGFQKSDLIIIAGRPSTGKTAFSLNVTLNVLRNSRLPVILFSLEMSKEQIMYRILATEAQLSQSKLKNGQLYRNDWIKLNKLIKVLSKLPIFIDDSPNLTIDDVRSKIRSVLLEHETLGLVIIDYLQLMQNRALRQESRVEEISKITRQLKGLAREFNVPLIALSQLSRNIETRVDKKPILADLRESGSIEQDADLVLMLSKTKSIMLNSSSSQNMEQIELIIAKHRNGPVGTVTLNFDKGQTLFSS